MTSILPLVKPSFLLSMPFPVLTFCKKYFLALQKRRRELNSRAVRSLEGARWSTMKSRNETKKLFYKKAGWRRRGLKCLDYLSIISCTTRAPQDASFLSVQSSFTSLSFIEYFSHYFPASLLTKRALFPSGIYFSLPDQECVEYTLFCIQNKTKRRRNLNLLLVSLPNEREQMQVLWKLI